MPMGRDADMSEHFSTSAVSFAGPLLTAESGVETTPRATRRIQKREGSSEENGFAILGNNGFKNEDYRCGGPGLVRLPTLNEILKPNEPLYILYHEELVGPLRDILEKWNVDSKYLHLVRRYHARDSPDTSAETVVVSAKKHELDSSWLHACQEIHHLFLQHGQVRLKIEISDERALEPVFSRSITATDPFIHKWQGLKGQILNILEGREWTLLSAHLRGPRNGKFAHTVVICVREDSRQNWNDVRDSIVHHLDTNDLTHTAVEIIRDSIFHYPEQAAILDEQDWNKKAKLGGSLGMGGESTSSFTFGGFLELQFHCHHQWKRFGMTNFHSIANDHCLDDWKRHGIIPDDSRNNISIDHPSLGDHNMSMKYYEDKAADIQTQKYYEVQRRFEGEGPSLSRSQKANFKYDTDLLNRYIKTIDLANEFHQKGNQYLGRVYAASGFRITATNRILDWALIEVERGRLSNNEIPSAEEIPRSRRERYRPDGTVLQAATYLEADMHLCKIGRRTGFTEGRLGALHVADLQSWSKNQDGSWTKARGSLHEIFPVAPPETFGDPGDSGAIIMDRNGSFVGLYVGGCIETGTSYFMEASDLFHDIKDITGAIDVRIPQDDSY